MSENTKAENTSYADTEAQLIAEAIAAFVYNSDARKVNGLSEPQEKVSPTFLPSWTVNLSTYRFCKSSLESL